MVCFRSPSCRESCSRDPYQLGWRNPVPWKKIARSPKRGVQTSAQRSVESLSLLLGSAGGFTPGFFVYLLFWVHSRDCLRKQVLSVGLRMKMRRSD